MAAVKITRTYPEPNPYDDQALAIRWLLTSVTMRQELYSYLRELPDAKGQPGDVGRQYAEEIAAYTHQRVGLREFTSEEAAHINGQLQKINELFLRAWPTMRGIIG